MLIQQEQPSKPTNPEYSSSLDAEATDAEDGILGAKEAYGRFGDSFALANKGLNKGTIREQI